MTEPNLNPAVTKAIEQVFKTMPPAVTHGVFNRHMFMEAVVVKGGTGAAIDEEDICKYAGITDKEFTTIKDEYVAMGVIKGEKNFCGVTLYSLQYDSKEGELDNLPEME